jgi:uncharacterized membrane protein
MVYILHFGNILVTQYFMCLFIKNNNKFTYPIIAVLNQVASCTAAKF